MVNTNLREIFSNKRIMNILKMSRDQAEAKSNLAIAGICLSDEELEEIRKGYLDSKLKSDNCLLTMQDLDKVAGGILFKASKGYRHMRDAICKLGFGMPFENTNAGSDKADHGAPLELSDGELKGAVEIFNEATGLGLNVDADQSLLEQPEFKEMMRNIAEMKACFNENGVVTCENGLHIPEKELHISEKGLYIPEKGLYISGEGAYHLYEDGQHAFIHTGYHNERSRFFESELIVEAVISKMEERTGKGVEVDLHEGYNGELTDQLLQTDLDFLKAVSPGENTVLGERDVLSFDTVRGRMHVNLEKLTESPQFKQIAERKYFDEHIFDKARENEECIPELIEGLEVYEREVSNELNRATDLFHKTEHKEHLRNFQENIRYSIAELKIMKMLNEGKVDNYTLVRDIGIIGNIDKGENLNMNFFQHVLTVKPDVFFEFFKSFEDRTTYRKPSQGIYEYALRRYMEMPGAEEEIKKLKIAYLRSVCERKYSSSGEIYLDVVNVTSVYDKCFSDEKWTTEESEIFVKGIIEPLVNAGKFRSAAEVCQSRFPFKYADSPQELFVWFRDIFNRIDDPHQREFLVSVIFSYNLKECRFGYLNKILSLASGCEDTEFKDLIFSAAFKETNKHFKHASMRFKEVFGNEYKSPNNTREAVGYLHNFKELANKDSVINNHKMRETIHKLHSRVSYLKENEKVYQNPPLYLRLVHSAVFAANSVLRLSNSVVSTTVNSVLRLSNSVVSNVNHMLEKFRDFFLPSHSYVQLNVINGEEVED